MILSTACYKVSRVSESTRGPENPVAKCAILIGIFDFVDTAIFRVDLCQNMGQGL
jgi:hypothetical protein